MSSHGSIHWSELASSDVEGSKKFFAETAGWSFDGMEMPDGMYWVANAGGVPTAGIMDVAQLGDANIPSHWTTYVAVDDIDKVVAATEANGGKVLRAPFDVPGVGRIAMLQDPGGAAIGMMTPAAPTENPGA